MNTFDNRTVLITGASAGIGEEFAFQLAPYVSSMILTARRLDRLEVLKENLQAINPELKVYPYGLDLTDSKALDRFIEWLPGNGFEIDFLINNAGLGDHGEFVDSEWQRIEAMLSVNVRALTRLTHALLPAMRERGDGVILNVSSVASLAPLSDLAVYAATKAYVTSFSEAIRAELRGSGVRVTTLCPGPVDTEFGSVAKREGEEDGSLAPDFFKVPVEQVVQEALVAVINDRPRVIPGLLVCLAMTAVAALPMVIVRTIIERRAEALRLEKEG